MRTPTLLVFLLVFGLACNASSADLSTDAGVQKAYEKATGKDWHEDDCIGRTGVKDVVLVGGFAHNLGCVVEGGFVGGEWMDAKALKTGALGKLGWAAMDAEARKALAREWTERVVYHWGGSVVGKDETAFTFDDTPAYTAPAVTVEGDAVVITLWIEEPPGMQDIDAFEQIELRFDATGAIRTAEKAAFSVDGARTRG